MNCPVSNGKVNSALCELFYPYGCGSKCKHLYERWMETEPEVQKLESEAKQNESGQAI
jgi:hypothetical protein